MNLGVSPYTDNQELQEDQNPQAIAEVKRILKLTANRR